MTYICVAVADHDAVVVALGPIHATNTLFTTSVSAVKARYMPISDIFVPLRLPSARSVQVGRRHRWRGFVSIHPERRGIYRRDNV